MGPKPIIKSKMGALGEIVVVERAKNRTEGIGVYEGPRVPSAAGYNADRLPVFESDRSLEETLIVPALEAADDSAIECRSMDDFGARDESADDPVALHLMKTKYGKRIAVPTGDDGQHIWLADGRGP
jgi:hypothetical protein